jgi:WXXGXW repeat (2 copies)
MRILRAVLIPLFVVAMVVCGMPAASLAQVGISVAIAPPLLPIYAQPPIPAPGYLWTPGVWNYGTAGYYWVPGTWARPPAVGLLWTPGYWGAGAGGFFFHAGYWGAHVGFYGGINYGFGYGGVGFAGGYWGHGGFYYNHAVNNFGNTRVTNVYNRNVTVNRTTNVSYNGGAGGVQARPTPAELAADREQHLAPTAEQVQHQQAAGRDPALQASVNHGNPPIAATQRPGAFTGHGVEAARGAAPARPAAATGAAAKTAPHAAAAPQQHHYAAPQQHHYAAPQQHHYAAPQQHHYAAPQSHPSREPATHHPEAGQRQGAVERRAPERHAAHEPTAHRAAEHGG